MSRHGKVGWLGTLIAVFLGFLGGSVRAADADKPPESKGPQVEVVFCLDTTGSMGGLLEGAKQKIWSISNQIAGGKPVPQLKIGLIAYRDKGDEYVTKVFDLTDDLDAVHGNLKGFQAAGGGDGPESVNQAVDDAVNKIKWSTEAKTLRMIFLVGDAPPHMDYKNDVKYPVSCTKACEKGIIVNTIQCGGDGECTKIWKDICTKAEGSFAQIAQDGGVVAVATPFDADLGKLNSELAGTIVVYGDADARGKNLERKKEAEGLAPAAPSVAADRAGAQAKSDGKVAAYDLLDNIRGGKVKLGELKDDQLPEELKKLKPEERKEYLDKLTQRRAELNKQVLELDKKRSEFITKKMAENKGKDSFDSQVLEMLRKQAGKKGIDY